MNYEVIDHVVRHVWLAKVLYSFTMTHVHIYKYLLSYITGDVIK